MPFTRDILLATGNPKKFRELVAVLSEGNPLPLRWIALSDLPDEIPEPIEDQNTFEANAALKARYYSNATGRWTLADDSGLVVDALGGAPGVYSARYANSPPDTPREQADAANNARLIRELAGVPEQKRAARFQCCLALADGDKILLTATGTIEGRIIDEPRGTGGFGYDPHFLVPHLGRTTAELPADHKNRISHRGQALRTLRDKLHQLLD